MDPHSTEEVLKDGFGDESAEFSLLPTLSSTHKVKGRRDSDNSIDF